MTPRHTKKTTGSVERATVVNPSAKPSVRLNGKAFEYKADSFNARSMAKVLRDSIAKRGAE